MNTILRVGFFLLLLLAACSGGSGDGFANSQANEPGSVLVVVDTRAGTDTIVQFLLAGATLEDQNGGQTGNLLSQTRMLTLDDPSGEQTGLRLRRVPSGDYRALHLILTPGSGVALASNGMTRPVGGPLDVRIEIANGLQHNELAASWVVVGHDMVPLVDQGGTLTWTPMMSGRLDGEAIVIGELGQPVANSTGVMTTARTVDDGLLQLDWSSSCVFEDEDGNIYSDSGSFLADLGIDDELRADGTLHRNGRCRVDRVRRGRRNDQPRLIGRVLSIDTANSRFEFRVQATTRRGNRVFLAVPETILVLAQNARIERPSGSLLTFADLAVDQLAKVKWISRTEVPGGLDEYIAREIEVPGDNDGQLHPQFQGLVQSVDVAANTLVMVPRHDDPIIIEGVSVTEALVQLDSNTLIERRERHGGGRFVIGIEDIQPGIDRIWVRAAVSGPATLDASRVLVRED